MTTTNGIQLTDRQLKLRNYHARKVAQREQQQVQQPVQQQSIEEKPQPPAQQPQLQLQPPTQHQLPNQGRISTEEKQPHPSSSISRRLDYQYSPQKERQPQQQLQQPRPDDEKQTQQRQSHRYSSSSISIASSKSTKQTKSTKSTNLNLTMDSKTVMAASKATATSTATSAATLTTSKTAATIMNTATSTTSKTAAASTNLTITKSNNQTAQQQVQQQQQQLQQQQQQQQVQQLHQQQQQQQQQVLASPPHSTFSNTHSNTYSNTHSNTYSNTSTAVTTTDNRESMKRMFAARRRKAQLEMTVGTTTNTTTSSSSGSSVGSVGGDIGNAIDARDDAAAGVGAVDGGVGASRQTQPTTTRPSRRSSSSSMTSMTSMTSATSGISAVSGTTAATGVSSKSGITAVNGISGATATTAVSATRGKSAKSGISNTSSSSTYASRRAYERFASTAGGASGAAGATIGNGGGLGSVKEESSHSLSSSTATAKTANSTANTASKSSSKVTAVGTTSILRESTSKDESCSSSLDGDGGRGNSNNNNNTKVVRFQSPTPPSTAAASSSAATSAASASSAAGAAAPSRNKSSSNNPQCSPPRSMVRKARTSANDGKGRSEVVGGGGGGRGVVADASLKKHQQLLTNVESSEADEDDEEEDTMEFVLFVAGLKREVAGDHVELWSGFQSLLGRPTNDHVPLYQQSYIEDGSNITNPNNNNGKKPKKKKKVQFDPQTFKLLTTIHEHYLMENKKRKKNEFMIAMNHLVNDKQTAKDRKEDPSLVSRSRTQSLSSSSSSKGLSATTNTAATKTDGKLNNTEKQPTSFRASKSAMSKSASMQLTLENTGDEDALDSSTSANGNNKNNKDSRRSSLFQSYKKKKSIYMSAYKSSSSSAGMSGSSRRPITPTSDSSKKSFSSDSKEGSSSTTTDSSKQERKKTTWLDALKKKQKSLRLKQKAEYDKPDQQTIQEEKSDRDVFMQQLSPRKKPKLTPTSSSSQEPHPWGQVKLRTTPKRESFFGNAQPDGEAAAVDEPHKEPQVDPPSPKINLFSVGDVINLDNLPQHAFPSQEESAMFPLKSSKEFNAGDDPEKVVVVGKTAIVTATCIHGNHAKKASVSWWCHRSEVRALTLNVEATGANLALTNGRAPFSLMFHSADVCLEFAQAFYRGPSNKSDHQADSASSSTKKVDTNKGDDSSNEPILTKDEESLLDRYRQFSQSDRQKLKLTCLSPKNQSEGVEVSLPNSSQVIDESVAEKYRKMLKMRIPPDAVRHKMVTEGVDPVIISAVLDAPPATSMEENSGSGTTLTSEEEIVASKYRKMLKMRIPPDAVRHKMTTEGVDAKIINAVLNEPKFTDNPNKLTDEEEVVASKYRKMLKMRIPPDAVRHKMTTEGVDAKIIDAVLTPAQEPVVSENELTSEEEVIAAKYRKMLKMAIPMDAVKHKMTQDSIDLKIVSAVTGESAPPESAKETKPPGQKGKTEGPKLSQEEEKIASTYRNMIKVCIPKDAVRHKMKQEGISHNIIEAVLGKENGGSSEPSKDTASTTNRLTIGLHWTTSNLAPELLQQSIFGKTDLKKRKLGTINPEEADIQKLVATFQKRDNSKNAKAKGAKQDDSKIGSEMAKLLDFTRANNIAIGLKKFDDFSSYGAFAEAINDLDPDCKIVGERVQFIPNLLPTPKEIMAVKKFKGGDDKLITAELFFRQLVSIKRIEDKVTVIQTMCTFEEHIDEARAGLKTLQEVCRQVMNSEKLFNVLQMVLDIGNFMNEGTLNGTVAAFKFESLSKLSQTKSSDGKTTVLDYIVETFIEKGERQTLFLTSEFPDIKESSRLSIGDLVSDMATLRKNYQLCKTELTKMKSDQSSKRVTRSMAKKIEDESEPEDPRKAMFAAIKARNFQENDEPKKSPVTDDPRQALFAAIQNRKKKESSDDEEGDSSSNVELSRGVHKLQKFLNHSKTVLTLAEQDLDAAIRACKGIAVYCGEEGGERSAAPLLQILCEFASSLEIAVKKYDEKIEAQKRKEATMKKKKLEKQKQNEKEKGKENTLNSLPMSSLKLSSLQPHVGVTSRVKAKPPNKLSKQQRAEASEKISRVLLVNRMLSEAPSKVKEDFLRGVTYDETNDPILKKIYEKEGKRTPKKPSA